MSKSRKPLGNASPLTNSPFADLEALRDQVEGDDTAQAAQAGAEPMDEPVSERTGDFEFRGRLVVRKEKKGRGGKGVTVIEGLQADPNALRALLTKMRKSLGCGGTVEGGNLVLSGAQVNRVATWLREAGARRVIEGN